MPLRRMATWSNEPPLIEISDCTPWGPRCITSMPATVLRSSCTLCAGLRSISVLVISVTIFDAWLNGNSAREAVTTTSSKSCSAIVSDFASMRIASLGLTDDACALVKAQPVRTPMVTTLLRLLKAP